MAYLDLDMHRALADAGYAPLDEYVQRQRERRRPVYFNVWYGGLVSAPYDTRQQAEAMGLGTYPELRLVVRPK